MESTKENVSSILARSLTKLSTVSLALYLILAASGACLATSTEFIQNGGFETGDLTGWGGPSPNPNPWIVVSNDPYTGYYSAYNPVQSSAVAETTLFQSFAPVSVGRILTAGFWYYHQYGDGSIGLATLLSFADGTSVQDSLYADDPSYHEGVWTHFSWMPLLAAYPSETLSEVGFFPKVGGLQYIDDVSITAFLPEPATWSLLPLGILILALRLKRIRLRLKVDRLRLVS